MLPTEWIADALQGPLKFRFVVQPLVALLLGWRDGRVDFAEGRTPFVIGLVHATGERRRRLREALRQVAVPLAFAIGLDALVQASMLGRVRLADAIWVGALLIALPYVVARGGANRALGRRRRRRAT